MSTATILSLTLKPTVDGTELIEISENGTGSFRTPLSAIVANYQLLSEKGAVNGYAGLDASQELLLTNFPTGTGLQVLRRNAGNTALEFATISSGGITSINSDTTPAQILAGTANRISLVDAGDTHTFDIDSGYVGQASITTLGTITTGVWNGTDVLFTNIQDITTSRFLGRVTAATGVIEELTGTQATTLLDVFTTSLKGLVPASGGSATEFLSADGTFKVPAGGGDMVLADVQTVTGAKTFLDTTFFLRNVANTFSASFVNTITANRIYTLPDLAGTIALTSDLTGKFDTAGTGLTSSGTTVNAIGTTNRISVSADAIDISTSYVGQASITTLGTITTGIWNGTTIAIANGGSGQTTQQTAINALTNVAAATNEFVLTKDTGTGDAIWKVAPGAGGGITSINSQTGATQTLTQQTNKILINSATNDHAFTLGTDVVTIDKANTFEDFVQTFKDNSLHIENPAGTFDVVFQTSAEITSDRILTIPLLGANRTMVVTGLASQITLGTEVTGAITDLSDVTAKTGTGTTAVFDTSPTIVTPTIASFANAAHSHQDAAGGGTLLSTSALSDTANLAYLNTANVFGSANLQTFTHAAGGAGIGLAPVAGDVTTPNNGEFWYNSTSNKFRARENGVTVDMIGGGGASPLTTQGDLFTFSTVDARLPVGTNGQVLSADSAETTGLKWVAAGAGDMILASVQTVTGAKTFADNALLVQNPAETFAYTLQGAAIAAARILNLPLITATDTIAVLGLAQTVTAIKTHTVGQIFNTYIEFPTGSDPAVPGINIARLYFKNDPSDGEAHLFTRNDGKTWDITNSLNEGDTHMSVSDSGSGVISFNPDGLQRGRFTGSNFSLRNGTNLDLEGSNVANVGLITMENPADNQIYIITPAAITADRILNLPLTTATDTLAALGVVQTWVAAQTFDHAGFILNPAAGDPATPVDGQIWYNSTSNKYKGRENGTIVTFTTT